MSKPKSKIDRKVYGLRVEKALYQEIQHLGIDLERNASDLLEEAMRDFFEEIQEKGAGAKGK
jgi:hypothetical protein